MIAADLALIDDYDAQIAALERTWSSSAKVDDPVTFGFLRTIPGIGPILGLILLYEIDQHRALPRGRATSCRTARLVRCEHSSAGQGEGLGRQEDRQRAPEVGVLRGGVPDDAGCAGGEVVDAAAGEEARQAQGPVDPGSEDRPGGVSPVAQAGGRST